MKILRIICLLFCVSGVMSANAYNLPPEEKEVWLGASEVIEENVNNWFTDGEFERCIPLLKIRFEADPANYDWVTDLGWMLASSEHPDEELAYYIRFRRENAGDLDCALPEAQFYFLKKVFAKVPPLLEGTLVDRSHPNNYRILANSYEKLGQYKDAKKTWEAYLKISPNDGQAKVNLQRVINKLGD